MVSLEYISRVLGHAGISSAPEGSFYWTISVPESSAGRATSALKSQAGILPYITLPDGVESSAMAATFTEVALGVDYATAVSAHGETTTIGRLLRSENFRMEIGDVKGVTVRVVKWRERPFVDRALRPTTALQGRVLVTGADGLEREYASFTLE